MSRATAALDFGRIDSASVVPLAEDRDRCLLSLRGDGTGILIECRTDDLWKIATACRDAVKRREEERRMDDLAAEAEPISDMRTLANALLRGAA
jgi:hypothetical protein